MYQEKASKTGQLRYPTLFPFELIDWLIESPGQVCDGIYDCSDNSDESTLQCHESYRVKDLMVDQKTVSAHSFNVSWAKLTVPGTIE